MLVQHFLLWVKEPGVLGPFGIKSKKMLGVSFWEKSLAVSPPADWKRRLRVYIHICMYMHIYVYINVFVFVYDYVYVFVFRGVVEVGDVG